MESTIIDGMSNDMVSALIAGGILGIGISVIAAIALIWYVFQVIANWKIFKKFGEPGWKAIIPVYNTYIQYKATWNTKIFWLDVVLSLLTILNDVGGDGVISTICIIVSWIALIGLLVLKIMREYNLSRAFDHGIGFTVGLFLLNPIFKLILGFGRSEYIGNATKIGTKR